MTEIAYAQNGHAPAAPDTPNPPASLEGQRQRTLDELAETFGPCIPYGPRRVHTLFPNEASAMLEMLWQRDPGKFARMHFEARGGNPSDLDGPKRARGRKPAAD